MKFLEGIFLKFNSREQLLLVFSLWVIFFLLMFNVCGTGFQLIEDWKNCSRTMEGHQMILNLKPSINQALEKQKKAQQNISYDKKQLSNTASSRADEVFPQRDYRELKSDERERYKQHRVLIDFDRASYEDVNNYALLIRQESPWLFLSEVKIEPNYPPPNSFKPTTFDATFEVSSVEFLNP